MSEFTGNEVEWKGEWNDTGSKWNSISSQEKSELGFVKESDGEFWYVLSRRIIPAKMLCGISFIKG